MSLGLVIDRFATGTYSVSRPGTDSYAAGVRTAGTPSTFDADMSVQPQTGLDLKASLAEGRKAEDVRQIWSRTELRDQDRITIGSDVFEVYNAKGHSILDPSFYRVLAARQKVGV